MSEIQFMLETNPPTEEERKRFGIFISHSNADTDYLNELAGKMRENGLKPIYDRDFLGGGVHFQDKIMEYINCYAAVVVLSEKSIKSDWVNYELGFLAGKGMPIVLWDPEGLLSLERDRIDNGLLNVHLSDFYPASRTSDQVVDKLKNLSVFSEIFKNECRKFTYKDFQEVLEKRVSTVMVQISSDLMNDKKELFSKCEIGTLVVNFGMFYSEQGDGEHCWARRMFQMDGSYSVEGAPTLCDHKCEVTGQKCAMFSSEEIQTDKYECLILNHLINNGRYFDKGEKYFDGTILEEAMLSFYVPVHNVYGTEFKLVVDPPKNVKNQELLYLFEEMGMNPTVSDSLNGWRIYLSLPDVSPQGWFRLEHEYHNNFLCPRATVKDEERL